MKNTHSHGCRALSQDAAGHARGQEFSSLMNYFWNYMDMPSASNETASTLTEWEPRMQIVETKDAVNVTAELPGVAAQDLSLSGEKKNSSEYQEKDAYFSEISYGSFKRTIPLPWDLDYDKASAEFVDGALFISIPKTPVEKQKFKKININHISGQRAAASDDTMAANAKSN